MDLLGPTIQDLHGQMSQMFKVDMLVALAKQVLDRVAFVHSKGFVYRDVKPENFTCEKSSKAFNLHIIDFGFAKKYVYPKTRQHIAMRRKTQLKGLSPFASRRAQQGYEQSRRDDLEAIGNMMMYLQYGSLPMELEQSAAISKVDDIAYSNMCTSLLPAAFDQYLTYTSTLSFEQEPDYDVAWKLLYSAIIQAREYKFIVDWTVRYITQEEDNEQLAGRELCA